MIRHLFHAIFAVLMWIVFVYYWTLVIRRPMNPDTMTALAALAVLTGVTTAALCVWIFHNIRLHRKYWDRRRRRRGAALPREDYLGRRLIVGDVDAIRRAGSIEVELTRGDETGGRGDMKIFKAV